MSNKVVRPWNNWGTIVICLCVQAFSCENSGLNQVWHRQISLFAALEIEKKKTIYYLIYETNNKTNTIKKKNSLAFCYINEVIKRNAFFHKQQYDIKFD